MPDLVCCEEAADECDLVACGNAADPHTLCVPCLTSCLLRTLRQGFSRNRCEATAACTACYRQEHIRRAQPADDDAEWRMQAEQETLRRNPLPGYSACARCGCP